MITKDSINLALIDLIYWKKQYIKKQLKKNPNITKKELTKKIKNARCSYVKNKYNDFDKELIKEINDQYK